MALKSLSFLAIFSLLVAASSLFGESAAFGGRKALSPTPSPDAAVGLPPIPADLGFTPLNSKDRKVIELATFAIDEFNKAHGAKLVFYSVMEAISTTIDKGTNYGLIVAAINDKKLNDYHVDVFVADDDNVKKLTSFAQGQ